MVSADPQTLDKLLHRREGPAILVVVLPGKVHADKGRSLARGVDNAHHGIEILSGDLMLAVADGIEGSLLLPGELVSPMSLAPIL